MINYTFYEDFNLPTLTDNLSLSIIGEGFKNYGNLFIMSSFLSSKEMYNVKMRGICGAIKN